MQAQIKPVLGNTPRITLLPPLNFAAAHRLMREAYLIITDSGGIQEEAPSYSVPVLVMRQVTERPEAVSAGTAVLTGTNRRDIVKIASRLLKDTELRDRMRLNGNPFGDGKATERIIKAIRRFLDGDQPLLDAEEEFIHHH